LIKYESHSGAVYNADNMEVLKSRRILSEQAKASVAYYAEDQELKEFRGFI